ncbi:MAG TPA: hypothetical protein VM076_14495 [Gemmatimonadaceae bacterium]|nr:hypothetical protein [Gemmatimonadaceae bacterium]
MQILVVSGASGVGKTAAVEALGARRLAGVRCFHFDCIGVPDASEMDRDYGGGMQWQEWATREWIAKLRALSDGTRVAVLDGQMHPSAVLGAPSTGAHDDLHVVMLQCARDVRDARLHGPRGQPELASDRMENWASHLVRDAEARGLTIIDTTALDVEAVADRLEAVVRRLGA